MMREMEQAQVSPFVVCRVGSSDEGLHGRAGWQAEQNTSPQAVWRAGGERN